MSECCLSLRPIITVVILFFALDGVITFNFVSIEPAVIKLQTSFSFKSLTL